MNEDCNTLRLRLSPPEGEVVEALVETSPGWSVTVHRDGDIFVLENITEDGLMRLVDELYRYARYLSGNHDNDLAATATSAAAKFERKVEP